MAILKGKAGRIAKEAGTEQSWRDIFKTNEDPLTAVFFGRIRYLSPEEEKNVLKLLIGDSFVQHLGNIKDYVFWPPLSGLENRSYVEPDVLIVCENAWILVEVKSPSGGFQDVQQWRNEIESLIKQKENDYLELGSLPDTIHFIALGRKQPTWQSDMESVIHEFASYKLYIHVREWSDVNQRLSSLLDLANGPDKYIYADWKEAFALYGLFDRMSFFDLKSLDGMLDGSYQELYSKWTIRTGDWLELYKLTTQYSLEIQLWN